jgi:hypothetical protein
VGRYHSSEREISVDVDCRGWTRSWKFLARVVLEMPAALGYSMWVVKMECSIFSSHINEFSDDSLEGKLSNFTSKNRLKTQVTGNCATQGVLQHSQGASQESSIMPSRRVL